MDDFTRTALADQKYVAFCYGHCIGNNGPGGAAMKLYVPNGEPIEQARPSRKTTNHIADMVSVIDALRETPEGAEVSVCLNSDYIKNGVEKYLAKWVGNNWRNAQGREVANIEKWQMIRDLTATRNVTFHKIKDHSGNPDKEHVCALALEAAKSAAKRALRASRGMR